MPVAVMKIVFAIVPTQAPFLVRPLVSAICNGVVTGFVDPGECTGVNTMGSRPNCMQCLAIANECHSIFHFFIPPPKSSLSSWASHRLN
jgi:hypothetical protein